MQTVCQHEFAGWACDSFYLSSSVVESCKSTEETKWGRHPAEYAKLETLGYLDVHDNYLTGQLTSAWFTKDAFNRHTFLEVRTVCAQGPPRWAA